MGIPAGYRRAPAGLAGTTLGTLVGSAAAIPSGAWALTKGVGKLGWGALKGAGRGLETAGSWLWRNLLPGNKKQQTD